MSWYLANYLSSTERSKYRDGQARSAVHRLADHRYRIRHCACSLAVILLRKLCHLSKTISLMYSIWQMTHLCDITYSPAKIGTSASMKACSLWNDIAFRVLTSHIPMSLYHRYDIFHKVCGWCLCACGSGVLSLEVKERPNQTCK